MDEFVIYRDEDQQDAAVYKNGKLIFANDFSEVAAWLFDELGLTVVTDDAFMDPESGARETLAEVVLAVAERDGVEL